MKDGSSGHQFHYCNACLGGYKGVQLLFQCSVENRKDNLKCFCLDPFVVHKHEDRVFTQLYDTCLTQTLLHLHPI